MKPFLDHVDPYTVLDTTETERKLFPAFFSVKMKKNELDQMFMGS